MLDITKIVGSNITRLRKERTWTLQYLADKVGTTPQSISGLEHGTRGLSVNQIGKMCEAFGCNPEELFKLPSDTVPCLIMVQLLKEIDIMDKVGRAELCAHAVAINAARGIKP